MAPWHGIRSESLPRLLRPNCKGVRGMRMRPRYRRHLDINCLGYLSVSGFRIRKKKEKKTNFEPLRFIEDSNIYMVSRSFRFDSIVPCELQIEDPLRSPRTRSLSRRFSPFCFLFSPLRINKMNFVNLQTTISLLPPCHQWRILRTISSALNY